MKNIDKNYYLILIIALLTLIPAMSIYTFVGHDTDFHQSNIYAILKYFYENKTLIPSKILPIIGNDFGYGTGIFYPRLAHYTIAIIYIPLKIFFGFSITTACIFFQFSVTLISGIIVYNLGKKFIKEKTGALLASIFYITSCYFFADFYTRGAFAESLIFIFGPLSFLGLYNLINDNKYKLFYIQFIVGIVGTVNSHLISGVYLTIFLILYLLFNYKKTFKKTVISKLIIASFIILLCVSSFLLPMMEHKFFGNYSVFIENFMASNEWAVGTALTFSNIFFQSYHKDGINFYLNFSMLFMMMLVIYKTNLKKEKEIKNILILFIISIILVTRIFPWGKAPSFMVMIQFPWRIMLFVNLFACLIAGYGVKHLKKSQKEIFIPLMILFSIWSGLNSINNIPRFYSVNNINISNAGLGSQKEYLPTRTQDNLEYFNSRSKNIEITKGKAEIVDIVSNTPNLSAKINVDNSVVVELPRLFYFGYDIKLENDNEIIKLDYKESKYGFIEVKIPSSGILTVNYKYSLINLIGNLFTVLGIIFFCLIIKREI